MTTYSDELNIDMFRDYTSKEEQVILLKQKTFQNSFHEVRLIRGMSYYLTIFFTLFFISFGQKALAHGDLDEKIDAASEEIKIQPDSAYLYFKRGKLYFQHSEFQEAIQDMEIANQLGYQDILCDLVYVQSYQALEKYEETLLYVKKIQRKNPTHIIATKIEAEVLFKQERFKESALNFEKVIKYARKRLPENYLMAAKSWSGLNTKKGYKKALAILQKGKKDLGTLFIFQEMEIELYLKGNHYKKALIVQEEIINAANRKEMAYFKAAEICLLSNNKKQAKYYLQKSLEAFNHLATSKKSNTAMIQLKQNIDKQMNLL